MTSKPEKIEELKFVDMVESKGWDCVKLSTQGPFGRTGRNDRMVIAPFGVVAFFEFKRGGESPEPLQDHYHERLEKMGHETHVVYTASDAYRILIALVKAARVKDYGGE